MVHFTVFQCPFEQQPTTLTTITMSKSITDKPQSSTQACPDTDTSCDRSPTITTSVQVKRPYTSLIACNGTDLLIYLHTYN